ncbi:lipoprotein insertase outer membrane protein LolB [Thalassotalea ganghwensis]
MIESRYSLQQTQTDSFLLLINFFNPSLNKKFSFLCLLVLITILSACSSQPTISQNAPLPHYSKDNRLPYLKALNSWQINGRIAFIDRKERNSATIFWRLNQANATEQLNLTTFLGINVLSVNLKNDLYQVDVDDKTYRSKNVDDILLTLTGYQLPANALKHWVKGITFDDNDTLIMNEKTQLPLSISSTYNNQTWNIVYQSFINVNGIDLPHRLTIKQGNFTIKLAISQWQI